MARPFFYSSPLSAILCTSLCFCLAAALRQSRWALEEESDGGEGAPLKGIVTVSPEDVHYHSVKQTGVRREESTFRLHP